MSRNFVGQLVSVSAITIILLSLTACSSNTKDSKESKDTSIRTESSNKTPKKKKKNTPKKVDTKAKKNANSTQEKTSNSSSEQSSNNNSGVLQKNTTSETTSQSNQNQSSTSEASQPTVTINSPEQAASLVAHSFGNAAPGSFNVAAESDGYHVSLKDVPNAPVTVVKSNGDFYDINGNLTTTYSKASAADGVNNEKWNSNQ